MRTIHSVLVTYTGVHGANIYTGTNAVVKGFALQPRQEGSYGMPTYVVFVECDSGMQFMPNQVQFCLVRQGEAWNEVGWEYHSAVVQPDHSVVSLLVPRTTPTAPLTCMWCGAGWPTKELLEKHEESCNA